MRVLMLNLQQKTPLPHQHLCRQRLPHPERYFAPVYLPQSPTMFFLRSASSADKKRWRTDWATGKRCPLPLVVCERINADNFLRAAEKRKHTRILTQIRGKDMVATEVRYHKLCYRESVRCTEQNQQEDTPDTCLYSASFNELCAVVEKRIVQGKELLRLSTLNNVFTKIAKKVEGVDVSGYKSTRLKKRLKDAFPQLLFVCPR